MAARALLMLSLVLTACGGAAATTTTAITGSTTTTTTTLPEPAYVPPECSTATPTTVASGATTTTSPPPAALSPEQQGDVVAALDAIVRDHYLYEDFNGTDWPGAVVALDGRIAAGLDTATFYGAMSALITSLGDDHSHFESPAEVAAAATELAASNDYVGIGGLMLPVLDEDLVTVLAVFPGSAAEHAGLDLHDSIIAVDGVPLAAGTGFRGLRGPECSLIVMTVRTPGEQARTVSAVRFRVEGGIPITARLVPTDDGRTIGYLLIPTLGDGSIDDQVRTALEEFGDLDGLILDLRVNGGGSSTVLQPLLALFTSGTVGDYVSRAETRPLEITADDVHNSQTVPLAVLIGEDTVSYAEVLAGTLAAAGRATLIGETTLGNVETLRGYDLPDGAKLWLAAERFYPRADPNADWERDGIIPDVAVASEWQDFTFETDPALPPALDALAAG